MCLDYLPEEKRKEMYKLIFSVEMCTECPKIFELFTRGELRIANKKAVDEMWGANQQAQEDFNDNY